MRTLLVVGLSLACMTACSESKPETSNQIVASANLDSSLKLMAEYKTNGLDSALCERAFSEFPRQLRAVDSAFAGDRPVRVYTGKALYLTAFVIERCSRSHDVMSLLTRDRMMNARGDLFESLHQAKIVMLANEF